MNFESIDLNQLGETINNLVTPTAALVSLVLVIYIARKQNKIMLNDTLKSHYERSLDNLDKEFDREIGTSTVYIQDYRFPMREISRELQSLYFELMLNEQFRDDHKAWERGDRYPFTHYTKRSYFNQLSFFLLYAREGIKAYDQVVSVIQDINASKLHSDMKELFKQRIRSEIVIGYLELIQNLPITGEPLIPDLFSLTFDEKPVEFVSFITPAFKRHFVFFKRELCK